METKHTPGPWAVGEGGLHVYYVNPRIEAGEDIEDPRHDSIIARCHDFGAFSGIDDEENAANASLIAAAPELLEALEGMISLTKAYGKWSDASIACEKAEAAIRKAKGE